jgi:hypothetical protein
MAASFTSATLTVLGNQRAILGQVHMNDGPGYVSFGWRHVNTAVISQVSCNSAADVKKVLLNGEAGKIYIYSCTSGDSFNLIALGW